MHMRPLRVVILADQGSIHCTYSSSGRSHGGSKKLMKYHDGIAHAIRTLGHEPISMCFDLPITGFIDKLLGAAPDVVFNSVEGVSSDRSTRAYVPVLLELLRIPYTGSGPAALNLCVNKAVTNQVLRHHGVPVPDFFVVPRGKYGLSLSPRLPLFVKPLYGGGKEGITRSALVRTRASLERRIAEIHDVWGQPAICEEYIEGRELTLSMLGDDRLTAFPAREAVFADQKPGGPDFLTKRVRDSGSYRKLWGIHFCDAVLSPRQQREVAHLSRIAFKTLGLRGYGRMDIRLARDGRFYFVEVNANPGLAPRSESVLIAWGDLPFESLIDRVLLLALKQHLFWFKQKWSTTFSIELGKALPQ